MRRKTFVKFLVLYFVSFVLLMLLYFPWYHYTKNALMNHCMQRSEAALSAGLQELDGYLNELAATAQSISLDRNMLLLSYNELPISGEEGYRLYQAKQQYGLYTAHSGFAFFHGFVLPNGISFLNSNVYIQGERMYPSAFCYEGFEDFSAWRQWLTGFTENYHIFPAHMARCGNENKNVLTLALRVPFASGKTGGRVFFAALDEEYLISNLMLEDVAENGTLTLFDGSGTLLYEKGCAQHAQYEYVEAASVEFGLSARVGIDRGIFYSALIPFKKLAATVVLVYLGLGVLVSLFYAGYAAKPIGMILNWMSMAGSYSNRISVQPEQFKDEYTYMRAFLEQTGHSFQSYEKEIGHQREFLKDDLLSRMMDGSVYEETAFERARSYFPHFPQGYRIGLIWVGFDRGLDIDKFSALRTLLLTIVNETVAPDTPLCFGSDTIAMVLHAGMQRENMVRLLCAIGEKLSVNVKCALALSDEFSGMEQLNDALEQARGLIRYVKGNLEVATSKDIKATSVAEINLNRLTLAPTRLYEAVMSANTAAAVKLLEEMRAYLSGFAAAQDVVKFGYFSCVTALMKANEQIQETPCALSLPKYDEYGDIHAQYSALEKAAEALCRQAGKRISRQSEKLERDVLEFVNAKISDPDLYARMVLDEFSLQDAALQRIMRNATGKSFFDYVDGCRMEKAKSLLMETDMSINEIMQRCGYRSINTFYKAVNRTYGMSPGKLREINKP